MTTPLPSAGRPRALFVQALREFSTNCEAPALTSSCPFYRIGDSGPWCLEECMDLLAEHHEASLEGILIDESFRIVRRTRRPRRGSLLAAKPFDAAEIHLADAQKPLEEWRPSALLVELRNQSAPSFESQSTMATSRPTRVRLVLERLGEVGLDGERILRTVFAGGMAQAVAATTVLPILLGAQSGINELPGDFDQVLDSWSCLLTGEQRTPAEWFALGASQGSAWAQTRVQAIFEQSRRIAGWLGSLPLADLLIWRSPTPEEFANVDETQQPIAPSEDRWVVDRFMQTYLDAWDYDSLLLEWDYLHGSRVAPCAAEAMRTRHVRAEDLAVAIAWKASRGEFARGHRTMTVASLVQPAVAHLDAGRFSAAAAIFDACRIAAPDDADAHNNYGFCLLPLDPQAALSALDRAASLGLRLVPINTANRMLALSRVGRAATALELAGRILSSSAWASPATGYLWAWDSPEPKLTMVNDVRVYIAELAASIANEACDDSASKSWSLRRRNLLGEGDPR